MMNQVPDSASASQRLDKWLWCARFFKTRNLAIEAVNGGRVQLNGLRVKPARGIRPGDRLEITRGASRFEVIVTGLAKRRGPAVEAGMLYEETPTSIETRRRQAEWRRLTADDRYSPGRPDKKQRRQIRDLRQRDDSD